MNESHLAFSPGHHAASRDTLAPRGRRSPFTGLLKNAAAPLKSFVPLLIFAAVCAVYLAACSLRLSEQEKATLSLFQEKHFVTIPNEFEEPGNGWEVTFSPDISRVAYRAEKGPKAFIVIDNKKGQEFDKVRRAFFSPDGTHMAYAAKDGDKAFLILDEQKNTAFDFVDDPVFSPDGGKLAYRAKQGNKFMVILNNNAMPDFEMVDSPTFSPDGSKVAFVAQSMLHQYKGEQLVEIAGDFENPRIRPHPKLASIIASMKKEGQTVVSASTMVLLVGDKVFLEAPNTVPSFQSGRLEVGLCAGAGHFEQR